MAGRLSLSQLTFLVGVLVAIGTVLILVAYALHRFVRREGGQTEMAPKPPRADDEAKFMIATLQGVIANLKGEQQRLLELQRAAEQRAGASTRLIEHIMGLMPGVIIIFNREGFITKANAATRTLLGIDTWSRRRYAEILGPASTLADCIRECLESGRSYSRECIEYSNPGGRVRVLRMSLSPWRAPNGEIEGAVCLLIDLSEGP